MIGPDNIAELPRLVELRPAAARRPSRAPCSTSMSRVFLRAEPDAPAGRRRRAFVTMMKGCDERCSFCIVPYTRGPERYRPSREIVAEIARLVARGRRAR